MIEFQLAVLEAIARQQSPNIYVELGICGGATYKSILPYVRGHAYAVDTAPGVVEEHVTQTSNPKSNAFSMRTDDFSKLWDEDIRKEIDLIFIDADHCKESVWQDFQNFYKWLKPNTGILAMHDSWPPNQLYTDPGRCGDCYKAIANVKRVEGAEVLTLPFQYGLTLVRKVDSDWRNG